MDNPAAQQNAQAIIDAIHYGYGEATIAMNFQQMVMNLNGRLDVFDLLPHDARLPYIIALIVAQA